MEEYTQTCVHIVAIILQSDCFGSQSATSVLGGVRSANVGSLEFSSEGKIAPPALDRPSQFPIRAPFSRFFYLTRIL